MSINKRPVYYEAIIEELDKLSCEDVTTLYRLCVNKKLHVLFDLVRTLNADSKR